MNILGTFVGKQEGSRRFTPMSCWIQWDPWISLHSLSYWCPGSDHIWMQRFWVEPVIRRVMPGHRGHRRNWELRAVGRGTFEWSTQPKGSQCSIYLELESKIARQQQKPRNGLHPGSIPRRIWKLLARSRATVKYSWTCFLPHGN